MRAGRSRSSSAPSSSSGRLTMRAVTLLSVLIAFGSGCKHVPPETKGPAQESGCRFIRIDENHTKVESVGDAGCPLVDGLSGGQGIAQ